MKKILVAFGALLFVMYSCSSDNSNEAKSNGPLLKSIVNTNATDVFTTNYEYSENKIFSVTVNSLYKIVYTYKGDLIVGMKRYDSNDLQAETVFEYDTNQRVVKETMYNYGLIQTQDGSEYAQKIIYVYNSDNTIDIDFYDGDFDNQNIFVEKQKMYLDVNGEVVKKEVYSGGSWKKQFEATYCTANSSFKNIKGFGKLPFIYEKYNSMISCSNYNSDGVLNNSSSFQYTFNSDNYPIQRIQNVTNSNGDSSISTTEFVYY